MVLHDRVPGQLIAGGAQGRLRELQLALLEVGPAETVQIGSVVRVEIERAADEVDRFVEPFAAFRQHVPQVVQRPGVVRVLLEHAPERALGLLVPPAALERGPELKHDQGFIGEPGLGGPQNLDGLAGPAVIAVEQGQRHMRDRLILVPVARPLE